MHALPGMHSVSNWQANAFDTIVAKLTIRKTCSASFIASAFGTFRVQTGLGPRQALAAPNRPGQGRASAQRAWP